jgi:predicted dehydrogenase
LGKLSRKIYPVTEAAVAYDSLKGAERPLLTLFSYEESAENQQTKIIVNPVRPIAGKIVNIAVAGAGGFAKGIHLPNIKKLAGLYNLAAVTSRTGHNAQSTAKQFGAGYATTAYGDILSDENIDAVLIATRHNLHAGLALQALQAGKHVLVEKPLAVNRGELDRIKDFYAEKGADKPLLLTGFNRRFSQYARKIKSLLAGRRHPLVMNYRMNAGYIPPDSWVHGEEGGGRNIGEACLIYDLFNYFADSEFAGVKVASLRGGDYYSARDNFVATVSYADGSLASLTYLACGSREYPKEMLEIHWEGQTLVLEDYKTLWRAGERRPWIETSLSDKGQKEEIEAFARAILQGGAWPNPLQQQLGAMEIALAVEEYL